MPDVREFRLSNGETADIHRRPSHGQMRQVVRWTQTAVDTGDLLSTEDALVMSLVERWTVTDGDGHPVPLKREHLDDVPQSAMSELAEELQLIADSIRPESVVRDVSRRLRALAETAAEDDRKRLVAMAGEFDAIMGLDPNA